MRGAVFHAAALPIDTDLLLAAHFDVDDGRLSEEMQAKKEAMKKQRLLEALEKCTQHVRTKYDAHTQKKMDDFILKEMEGDIFE